MAWRLLWVGSEHWSPCARRLEPVKTKKFLQPAACRRVGWPGL